MSGASDVTGQGEVAELRGGRAGLAVGRGAGQESRAAQRIEQKDSPVEGQIDTYTHPPLPKLGFGGQGEKK